MADTETMTDPNLPAESVQAAPGGTNGTLTDWRGSLPDDLRAEKALADFKDVGSLAKSYVETKRMVGDAVRVPGKDAKPEEVAAFHRKLGVPESPDKYEVKLPELPKDHPAWDTAALGGFKGVAHQAGLTPQQVEAVVGWYAQHSIQTRDVETSKRGREEQVQAAQAVTELEKDWGPKDGPTWKRNEALARNAVRQLFADDPKLAQLTKLNGSADAAWVRGLAHIGEQMLEHGYLEGDAPAEIDTEAMSRQIAEITKELDTMNQGHPRRAELLAQKNRLYQMRYGGGAL